MQESSMSDQQLENRPADTRPAPLVTRDESVTRSRRARRPLWHLVPRTAGYGVVFFVIWMVLTMMFPNIFTRSSERAVVDSQVTLVTSPVEGIVTEQHVAIGKSFEANQPLMTVQNPNIDRALLIDLTGKALDNQQRYDAARAELAGDESQLAATQHDLQRYQAASQREHAADIHALQARLAAAKAQVDQQEDVVNRNQAMQWAGAVSEAYTNASRYQLSILSNAKAAAAAELEHAITNGDASRSKVYASATDGPVASLAQRSRLLSADIVQRKAEMTQFEAYGQSVNKLIDAEKERLERLTNLEIRSSEPGIVEDVLAPPGTRVAAGATLIRASNCAQSRVVAVFPRSLSDDLLPGTHLNVRMDGVPFLLPASVAEVLPRASEGEQARYFVPFPPIEKNEIYVIAKLDRPLSSLPHGASAGPAERCAMGHWAKVSLDQSWLVSNVSDLGHLDPNWLDGFKSTLDRGGRWLDDFRPTGRHWLNDLKTTVDRGRHWLENLKSLA
ncbi:HlyD family secretion protein [Burkholderia oklahomensis]|uniref:HlyD family secretion protein n=1 Tax=Burkholderia oklahomensis TaxID=342113 RepID=UPI00016A832C|nr:multidrug transporter [Burkholderia oklahomensis]AOI49381.1 multidrug transporter [Burkholderia oklahomensis C6786]KUY62341.1 multidrug transporter [Burkholderia oklahomensis C6786]MBI0362367.1 multidrug transporter [Burkholderia oklahomensis]